LLGIGFSSPKVRRTPSSATGDVTAAINAAQATRITISKVMQSNGVIQAINKVMLCSLE
jgi:hypothetical protein